MVNIFNIRVYGIWINHNKEVLLTDEYGLGMQFTKFPGGGLEFGEGPVDCLKREFREEMGQEIEVLGHFYTTDYFQPSAFNKKHQLISIYYLVKPIPPLQFKLSNQPFDFEQKDGAQSFRQLHLKEIDESELLFPVDKLVLGMLKEAFLN
jgi:8-oxo-dGTP diphosphatase